MSFSSDWLLDRIRLKRRLRIWQGIGIVAVLAAVMILVFRVSDMAYGERVARIWVDGVIMDDHLRDQALMDIANDPDIKALVVRVNSPGGTVVGGEALYRSLRDVAAQKPVVAVMGELATSAGYMTAIGADYIVAREGTVTGSIGVLLQSADITGMLDKIGVKPVSIKSHPLKAMPNPMEPMTKEAFEANELVIRDMYNMFVEMVAARRPLSDEEVRQLADGRVYTGRQALDNKLIDALGGEGRARIYLADNHQISQNLPVEDVIYHEEDFWGDPKASIMTRIFGKSVISKGLSLDGLVSVWQP